MNINIRPFKDSDAVEISSIVCRNLREINSKDYSSEKIENFVNYFTPDKIIQYSLQREMFVAEVNGKLVGTASLAKDNRTDDEKYICLTVFVLPEKHGLGIGKKLMEQVEETARNKDAKILHVPASRSALQFYRKQGYKEDNKEKEEEHIWMSKVFENSEGEKC